MDTLVKDLRLALRLLAKSPLWTAIAALTVALGIGATAAIFSIVYAVLLRPLPFPQPQQLYWVTEMLGRVKQEIGLAPDYFTMREQIGHQPTHALSEMAAFVSSTMNWTGTDRPEQLNAAGVSASFFPLLQITPLRGRLFRREEDLPGADRTVMLSYAFWQSHLGGDPSIVGKTIRLDREPALVVGIMPRRFDFPQGTDVWMPMQANEAEQRQRVRMLFVNILARAKPGASSASVETELERLTEVVYNEYPSQYRGKGFVEGMRIYATPLQQRLTGHVRPALVVLAGAVALMLLIVCFNVANLMLARAASRQREISIRVALGAPRRRIVSQLVTESLVISMAGGAIGAGLASGVLALLNSSSRLALAGMPEVSIDLATLGFTFGLTLLTGLIFGLSPALSSFGFSLREALQRESRAASGSIVLRRLRQGLVVAQLALSLTLLIGAGLLLKSFLHLRAVDPGFRAQNVLTARVSLAGPSYSTTARQIEFFQSVLDRVRRLPGVQSAAAADVIPVSGRILGSIGTLRIEGQPVVPRGQEPGARFLTVSPAFFGTLGVPVFKGRPLDERDAAQSAKVIVVNQAFARQFFPGEDPVGRAVTFFPLDKPIWRTIVGVTGNIHEAGLDEDAEPTIYRPLLQAENPFYTRMGFLIRTSADPSPVALAIRQVVASIDRDQPIYDVKTMERRLADSLASQRFNAMLIGCFALIAMLVAAVGVYGVMSYLVTLRTAEIGIRLALGALPMQVLRLVVREGLTLGAAGILIGIVGALTLGRFLSTLLLGVKTLDVQTFLVVTVVLLGTVAAACYIPARRASQVDPLTALRHD